MTLQEGRSGGLDAGLPRRLARLICRGVKAAPKCVKAAALALLSSLLLAGPLLAAPREITIEAAVDLALQRNTSIVVAEKTKTIYDERVRQYYSNALPKIKIGGQYSYNIEKASFFIGGAKVPIGANNQYGASIEADQVLWSEARRHRHPHTSLPQTVREGPR